MNQSALRLCGAVALSCLVTTPVFAQAAGCLVEEAGKAALDRQIELIKATAADPEDSFSGPDACIDGAIFDSFDLSTVIPDLSGFITSLPTAAIQAAIDSAKTKACEAIQTRVTDTIGTAQSSMNIFDSGLTVELQDIIKNGWSDL